MSNIPVRMEIKLSLSLLLISCLKFVDKLSFKIIFKIISTCYSSKLQRYQISNEGEIVKHI